MMVMAMVRWSACAAFVAGCGPQVGVPGDDGTATNDAASTSGATSSATVSTTVSGDPSGPVTTAMPPFTTAGDDDPPPATDGFVTTSDGPPDTGEDMCDCQGEPAGLRTPLDDGHTAAEMLAFIASTDYAWTWPAIEGQPDTTLHIDVVYEDGAITDEVGGCCGSFLCAPCPNGVTIEAFFRLTTDDGLLDEYVPATITGTIVHDDIEDEIYDVSAEIPLGSLAGTLAGQMFTEGGRAVMLDHVVLVQTWEWPFQRDGWVPQALLTGHPGVITVGISDP